MNQQGKWDFGQWMQQKRRDAGLSQREVAQRLHYNKSLIALWEGGLSTIPLERLFDLSGLYKISMEEILIRLRLFEPERARKFEELAEKFLLYHFKRFEALKSAQTGKRPSLHNKNYQDIDLSERAYHHRPFSNTINSLESIRKLTVLYIIRH